ncbi:MAG: 3-hydroxyacyl-CoA dehydrogenase family protein [Planctomycetota bacterium]
MPSNRSVGSPMTPSVHLLGAGVVSRAIAKDHLNHGLAVRLLDIDAGGLLACRDALAYCDADAPVQKMEPTSSLHYFDAWPKVPLSGVSLPDYRLVIESVPEEIGLKQRAFEEIARYQTCDAIYTTNTSTLSVNKIAADLDIYRRLCGLHFFMPVINRPAVELIVTQDVDQDVVATLHQHASMLGKDVIEVEDRPGFLVNRMLSPYLNEALDMLCQGVPSDRIENAAMKYGMPMSPLELIDTIGAKTMWQAGRVYWQAFPDRVNPNPLVPRMLKVKRLGRDWGSGIFDYESGVRSESVSDEMQRLVERYAVDSVPHTDDQVQARLAIPMFIEAELAMREEVVESFEEINIAMEGGLGYKSKPIWTDWFESRGSSWILSSCDEFGDVSPAMRLPDWLRDRLSRTA